jgi:hypothetical protein
VNYKEARKRVIKLDLSITEKMCDISDLEYEIEKILLKRKSFVDRHSKLFTADELRRIKREWSSK